MEGKPFYRSKTFWTNILAAGASISMPYLGLIVSAEEQVAAITIINLILRAITREPIGLR